MVLSLGRPEDIPVSALVLASPQTVVPPAGPCPTLGFLGASGALSQEAHGWEFVRHGADGATLRK